MADADGRIQLKQFHQRVVLLLHCRPESVDLVGIIGGEVAYRDRDAIRAHNAAMRFSRYYGNDETRFIFC